VEGVAVEVVEMQRRVPLQDFLEELLEEEKGMFQQGMVLLGEALDLSQFFLDAVLGMVLGVAGAGPG